MHDLKSLDDIRSLIANRVEENRNLEYKAAGALSDSDGKKREISKDVSAFANSDGGTIVYGLAEYQEKERCHLPEKIDPVDRKQFTREWLEQVIQGNISPNIEGLEIEVIDAGSDTAVYVVNVPASTTAHMAKDQRYYRRHNFSSVPMDDYEVRMVMNRLRTPQLEILFGDVEAWGNSQLIAPILLANKSKVAARSVLCRVAHHPPPERPTFRVRGMDRSDQSIGGYYSYERVVDRVFREANALVGRLIYQIDPSRQCRPICRVRVEAYCDLCDPVVQWAMIGEATATQCWHVVTGAPNDDERQAMDLWKKNRAIRDNE